MPAERHINTLKVSHLKSFFKNDKHQKIVLDVLAKKPLMPSQRSPRGLLWVIPVLQALGNTGHHHTSHYHRHQETRLRLQQWHQEAKHRRQRSQDEHSCSSPIHPPPPDLADPATYRGDDGGHPEGLLEDESPPFFCWSGDNVSVNTAGFL